jgi:hypothetical protein
MVKIPNLCIPQRKGIRTQRVNDLVPPMVDAPLWRYLLLTQLHVHARKSLIHGRFRHQQGSCRFECVQGAHGLHHCTKSSRTHKIILFQRNLNKLFYDEILSHQLQRNHPAVEHVHHNSFILIRVPGTVLLPLPGTPARLPPVPGITDVSVGQLALFGVKTVNFQTNFNPFFFATFFGSGSSTCVSSHHSLWLLSVAMFFVPPH